MSSVKHTDEQSQNKGPNGKLGLPDFNGDNTAHKHRHCAKPSALCFGITKTDKTTCRISQCTTNLGPEDIGTSVGHGYLPVH